MARSPRPPRSAWRRVVVGAAAVAGLLAGAGVAVAAQGDGHGDGTGATAQLAGTATGGPDARRGATAEGSAEAGVLAGDGDGRDDGASGATTDGRRSSSAVTGDVLLAWAAGGLSPALVGAAEAHPDVDGVSVGRSDVVDLVASRTADGRTVDAPADGWAIPLDAVALDPEAHVAFVGVADRADVTSLGDGEALLGRTSAALRRLGPGGVVTLSGGHELTVAAIVDDVTIGGAELAVTVATGERVGVRTPRYLLAAHHDARPAVEAALRSAAGASGGVDGAPVRFRAPGETPFLRQGDAVLTPAQLKDRFGEFALRRAADGRMFADHDAAWRSEHVVRRDVPILGVVECHRAVLDALAGALGEVEAAGLAGLVRPEGYAGCWVPRLVGEDGSVSHHAWGVALDLNWDGNPSGAESSQDPRVVEVFARWGFTWGGEWLEPDPAHFEYVGPPA